MSTTKDRTSRPSAVQLVLLDGGRLVPRREWQLDERTRRIGRMGVAQARAILKEARPPQPSGRAERRAS
jgi:hypothetical protein